MSDALDYVRNSCGIAGEEVADMVDALEAEIAMLRNYRVVLSEEQKERFDLRCRDLMKWLCDNCHPHTTIIITPTSAELVEGIIARSTTEYVRD